MPTNYDKIDAKFSWNGDLIPGKDGDIADTSSDQIQSLIQEIQSVVNSSLGDWLEHPSYGAGLDDFIGEANTKETSEFIKVRLFDSLVANNVVKKEDLSIVTIPVGPNSIMAVVRVKAQATPNNSLEQALIAVTMIFDYNEQGVFFLEEA